MQTTVEQPEIAGTSGRRSALAVSSAVTTTLVLAQAILAGRGWFVSHAFIDIHAGVASLVMLAAIAQVVFAFLALQRRQSSPSQFRLSLAITGLIAVQIALGYAGKESGTAASLHIPNGVLIFGLSVAATILAWDRGRTA